MSPFHDLPREQDPFEMDWPWAGGNVTPPRATLEDGIDIGESLLDEDDAAAALVHLDACFDELLDHADAPGIDVMSARLFRLIARARAALGERELAAEQMELALAISLAARESSGIAAAMLDGFTLRLVA